MPLANSWHQHCCCCCCCCRRWLPGKGLWWGRHGDTPQASDSWMGSATVERTYFIISLVSGSMLILDAWKSPICVSEPSSKNTNADRETFLCVQFEAETARFLSSPAQRHIFILLPPSRESFQQSCDPAARIRSGPPVGRREGLKKERGITMLRAGEEG